MNSVVRALKVLVIGMVVFAMLSLFDYVEAQSITLISNNAALTNPVSIATDGEKLYIGNNEFTSNQTILSVPIEGGDATVLYSAAAPTWVLGLTLLGTDLFWIDPNGDPDATAIFRGSTSGGPVTKIYSGFATGQPIVDGSGITTDGSKLYTADEVQGRVHSMNPDGSTITFLNSRYGGFFDLEHLNTIVYSGGILYIADDGNKAGDGIPPQVVSIPITGGAFTTLHSGAPLVHPDGIAIGNGTIFLSDPGAGNTIWSLPISGGTPTALVSGAPFNRIRKLIFYNNALYVADRGSATAKASGPGAIYKVYPATTQAGITVPTGLTATSGANSIRLAWNPNPEPEIEGYNIYRSATADGTYTKINVEPITDTDYTNEGLTLGEQWFYKITAVNTAPLESDMTNSVSATVGSIVVWMPDYRGNAGDEVTLLINAANATGLSSNGIDVKVTYDTGLLTPLAQFNSGTTVEKTALTEGFLLFDNSEIAAGQINISGVSPGMTVTGEGHLFDIKFNVQSTVTPGEYCEHIFVVVKFKDVNGEDLTVDYTDTAVFTVAADYIRGDINGDGEVDSGDAILALKIATGEIIATWLQMQAGDINGDGVIDSADAILILRIAVGLPVNPSGGVGKTRMAASYTLTVGQAIGLPNQTIRVPISIDNASGFSGADIRVNYDSNILTATGAYTTSLSSGFNLNYNVGSGWIDIAMSSPSNLSGGSGSLVELEFRINTGATLGSSSPLTISQKKLAGQYGENVAWESTVSSSNGSVGVLGVSVDSGRYGGGNQSDIGIFRSSSGLWAIRQVTRCYFGSPGDISVSGDYNGDGTTDITIFRSSSGLWAIRGVSRMYFGSSSDLPVPGDYNGDGVCDVGIFRASSGLWAIRGVTRAYFGGSSDFPVSGDYDGVGGDDIGIFRSTTGLWAIRGVTRFYFGGSSDFAVPGDYTGAGIWFPGIFRSSTGLWAIKGVTRAYFGASSDLPVPADYDGLGDDEIGIFRTSSGLWAVKGVTRIYYGTSGDIPVTR